MDLLINLALGFGVALSWQNLLWCFGGVLLGTLIGVLPGIGPVATIAMLLPVTFTLPPVSALIMLAGIYYGAQYGGSTTAILVNLPGESSSVVTALDGYQMARQGRAGPALGMAAIGSFFAGSVATIVIALFAPPLAEVALKFGPTEYFSLMVLGLIAAVVLAHGSLIKAIAMVILGLLLGLVGTDVNSGRGAVQLRHLRALRRHRLRDRGDGRVRHRRDHVEPAAQGARATSSSRRSTGSCRTGTTSGSASRPSCAARCSARRSASCPAVARCSPRSPPTRSRRRSRSPPRELRQGRHPRRRGAGVGEQRRRADVVHPAAHARHPVEPGDGADDRRDDDPGHRARAAGDDRAAAALLGNDRLDVGGQPDAGGPQPAADRHVDQAAHGALPPAVPGDPGVLRHRRLQRQQQLVRHLHDGGVRGARLRLDEARVRAGAADPRLHPRADDGGEPAPGDAALARRSVGVLHQADLAPCCSGSRCSCSSSCCRRRSRRSARRRSRRPSAPRATEHAEDAERLLRPLSFRPEDS